MSVTQDFLNTYIKNYDFYKETGRICAQICETRMEQMGIRGIVSYRAKKPERLRDKLDKRNMEKQYASIEDIAEDIKDLAGVRIALYFPGDFHKVQQMVEKHFQVVEYKKFPEALQNKEPANPIYQKRFAGYWAIHYRAYLLASQVAPEEQKYTKTIIEIQVASALLHAWAEVEHDLVYKPYSGELSYEELQILDELNGLVLSGEIALERLQKAVKNRVSREGSRFHNHYELASYLNNRLSANSDTSSEDLMLGRVDLMFKSIRKTALNTPERLRPYVLRVDPQRKDRSVVEQLLDIIRKDNPDVYNTYREKKDKEELKIQLETLQMNSENGNRQGEANTLANIGFIYSTRGNYEEAIHYFLQATQINHEIGSVQGEANQLLNVGSTYRLLGEREKALEYCNKALALHRQISYKQGQAYVMGTMGNIYFDEKNMDMALRYYYDSLGIYRDTGYKYGEVRQLLNIGLLMKTQEEYDKAAHLFQEGLKISREQKIRQCEGDALHYLGSIAFEQGNVAEAFTYYHQALDIQDEIHNEKSKIEILLSMGKACAFTGEKEEARSYLKEALDFSIDGGYKSLEEEALNYMTRIR